VPDGPVAVQGRVQPHDGVVETQLTGDEAVCSQYERRRPEFDGRAGYETLDRDLRARPFRVVDESGAVVVDPTDATPIPVGATGPHPLSNAVTNSFTGDPDGALAPVTAESPEALAAELTGRGESAVHVESALRPGEEVFVYGVAEDGRVDAGRGRFVLTDLSRAGLLGRLEAVAGFDVSSAVTFALFGAIAVAILLVLLALVGIFLFF
jgi:hypothetical protein